MKDLRLFLIYDFYYYYNKNQSNSNRLINTKCSGDTW